MQMSQMCVVVLDTFPHSGLNSADTRAESVHEPSLMDSAANSNDAPQV